MNKEELINIALEARKHAYVPYSEFEVGAAIVTKDGKVYKGANIENSSYGLTNCAERTAIFKAVSEGDRDLDSIAIVADTESPVSPCGACRQVMTEFFHPKAKVYLANLKGKVSETTIEELLPDAFKQEDLNEAGK